MIVSIRLIFSLGCFLLILSLGITWTQLSRSASDTDQQLLIGDLLRAEASIIERRLMRSLSATYLLALELQQHNGEIENFDIYAARIIELLGGISSLQLAPGAIVEKIYPLAGNESALGFNILDTESRRKEALLAIENRRLTLAGPFELVQGGTAVIGRNPVFISVDGEERFWGFTQALIRLDELLSGVGLQQLQTRGFSYQLHRIDPTNGDIDVFARSELPLTENSYIQDIIVPNARWILSISPAHGGLLESNLPGYLLSLAFALLFSFLLYCGLKSNAMLREARNVALRANNAKDEFIAGVSHEIRTPLSGMTGVLRLLKRSRLDRNQMRYIDSAVSSGDMLQVVIDDLIGLSRSGGDSFNIMPRSFDLAAMVEDVAYMLALDANRHSIDLVVETDVRLPWMITSDPVRLRQVLHGLLSNAIRFGKNAVVLVYARRDADQVQIGVIDFSGETVEQQKSPGSAADKQVNNRRRSDSAGIGLGISRRLVEALGSQLQIEDDIGAGSHFHFRIPLNPAAMEVYDWNPPKALQDMNVAILSPLQQRRESYRQTLANWQVTDIQLLDYDCDKTSEFPAIHPCQLVIVDQSSSEHSVNRLISSMQNHSDWRDALFMHLLPQGSDTGTGMADVRLTKPVSRADLFAALLDMIYRKSFDFEFQENIGEGQAQLERPLNGKRLLLVEDDQINKIIALEILGDTAAVVDVAVDGEHALEQVQREHYDLILMDINLPVMDGYQATRAIRELGGNYLNLPIIAMTAYAQQGDASKSASAGMSDHITKPFDADEFIAIIGRHIEGRS